MTAIPNHVSINYTRANTLLKTLEKSINIQNMNINKENTKKDDNSTDVDGYYSDLNMSGDDDCPEVSTKSMMKIIKVYSCSSLSVGFGQYHITTYLQKSFIVHVYIIIKSSRK